VGEGGNLCVVKPFCVESIGKFFMGKGIDLSEMRGEGFLEKIVGVEKERIQKVSERGGWLSVDSCPVCSSTQNKFILDYNGNSKLKLCRCLSCELVYFLSRPANLSDLYGDEDYLAKAKKAYLGNEDYRLVRFATERIEIIKEQTSTITDCSLLDVGCGTGWFLGAAKKSGFIVSGQEFSEPLANFTSSRLGVKVYHGDLGKINTKFHFITAFDVLEHVPDPVQFISQLKNLLYDDGKILVFSPNIDSFAIAVAGAKSNLVIPTSHLTYFNRASIYKLAEKTKLEVTHFETCGIDIGDMKAFSEWGGITSVSSEKWQALADALQPHIDSMELGNHLRAVFKKVKL
jgi:2-polyprenyl-3-methyl-5-hydroxy-6-metoxy-1,4-benzoquinol methylase